MARVIHQDFYNCYATTAMQPLLFATGSIVLSPAAEQMSSKAARRLLRAKYDTWSCLSRCAF